VIRTILLVLVVAAGAAPVRAQDAAGDTARSKELYDQGSRAYKAGDYRRAVELFLEAYDLSGAPAILFNIAQAYRLDGACADALLYYRRSLAEEPDAANRAEVEERIAEMETCTEKPPRTPAEPPRAAATAPPSAAAEPPASAAAPSGLTAQAPEPSRRRAAVPRVVAGVGTAAALTGAVMYLQASAKFDEVESTCPCEPGEFSGWETATDASSVLMGAGLATAAAGLIWWWKQPDGEPKRVGLVPTAGGIGWAGSF
jgi:tetratricopeptide (TPR) repeat protein